MDYSNINRRKILDDAVKAVSDAALKPLNGEKTHPLSAHAREELANIARAPIPTAGINPGVINRLMRENLAEIVQLPSPFKVHKGGNCPHLQITEVGRKMLESF